MTRKICIVTTTRADYGYLRPIIRELLRADDVELQVIAGGTHLVPAYGMTIREIEADGIPIAAKVEIGGEGGTPLSIATATANSVAVFAQVYDRLQPDILVLLGDRYEILGAALARLPFVRSIAHIAGGESTEGAIDDSIRHALTKLSHLHFVATEEYARRVIQMGEEPWRVTVSGAATLDNVHAVADLSDGQVEALIGMPLCESLLLTTFHPETLAPERTTRQIQAFIEALETLDLPVVCTYPNADAYAGEIVEAVRRFVGRRPAARVFVSSLGTRGYFAVMRRAAAMVGNSSSGIVEAASFGLPVVNIGDRQRGRTHGANVLHAPCEPIAIVDAVRTALSPKFRQMARQSGNPYGDGHAAARIATVLRSVPLDDALVRKSFYTG